MKMEEHPKSSSTELKRSENLRVYHNEGISSSGKYHDPNDQYRMTNYYETVDDGFFDAHGNNSDDNVQRG